ncbi:hypothetical protein TVAG_252090 [Trichomonas vaginalis G3]|uniref:F5/8 type C domain-containing protein n=1 Tax=Trichomonas vaginalis (strain ATCC PRA-98 / G3) TaxID=412133 RepID=A2G9V9_TRIV3|nr:ankyrin repeat domain-containing protein 61 family [Trichomonas vaginalis G3]EAX86060.1 hypothetical protein TVAG_252090 [Trichomonas vaginalis G3]KAI5499126.1 ankyrin repeat domain-containing protein 61 family [Trichomonas vaginalis G3]|eukprot:XP_001298990.1 hypothetical protein [Trichomonas vaginalis G3]
MPRIKWEKLAENVATLPGVWAYPIDIRINNKNFKSNFIFLSCISNKVKNDLYRGNVSNKYAFNCSIKDQKTYEILEDLFLGQLTNNNLTDSINTDLFQFALSIECQDLIEFYYEKFELSNFSLENFDKNIIYCKYCDYKDEFITFVSQNIANIGVPKLVEVCNYLGYNFAENIIRSCLKQSLDFNEFISSLIESNSLFFNLILNIDCSKLFIETKIRIVNCYIKAKITDETISQYIISYLPTITHECHFSKQENDKLRKETEISKQEIDKLRKETEISKQEIDKLRKETEVSKQEIDKLRKENEILATHNYSGNPYDGIFSYLRMRNNGQNPLDCGAVSVSTSQGNGGNNSDLFEYTKKNHQWYLKEIANNSVSFDFKDKKVSLSAYTIKSRDGESYWEYPVDFAIEGSNDFTQWEMIDDKPNNTEMGGNDKVHTWFCSQSPFYRYIRFRLKSIHSSGGLLTDHFEFFGKII